MYIYMYIIYIYIHIYILDIYIHIYRAASKLMRVRRFLVTGGPCSRVHGATASSFEVISY